MGRSTSAPTATSRSKWILPALAASPEVLARFRREALAAGRINHPNVVTIFDVVEHQGSACLVMELLAGETLAERMKRTGPMAFVEAVAIMLPAMRGVAAAHAHGVIHRDLEARQHLPVHGRATVRCATARCSTSACRS